MTHSSLPAKTYIQYLVHVGSRIGVFCFLGVIAGFLCFELRAAHGHTHRPHVVTPHLHIFTLLTASFHLLSKTSQSINIGLESPTNIFSSVFEALFLQAHLTVACVWFQNHMGCVSIGSAESEPTCVHQLRVDTRHVPSHI